jgi:hypothetical protein
MIVALWIGSCCGNVQADDGMARLVVGGQLLLVLGHHHGPALGPHHDLVLGAFEIFHRHEAAVHARGHQRRLVHEVGEVRTRETGRAAGDDAQVHVGAQRHLAGMDAEDALAAPDVGVRHLHLAVEAAGAQQRGVKHVGPVRGRDDDDALVRLEAVHLDQKLVQRLLAFVVAAAVAHATGPAHGVDLVDEDDAGRVLLGLFEHVAHAARADADEHLDEVGARDGEEGHARLARDGARQEGLTGTGRTDQQRALGILPPRRENFCGLRRNSTISSSSSLASSMPATSSKVTRPCFSVRSLALDLPKPIAPPRPPPCIRFMKKIQMPMSTRTGSHRLITLRKPDCSCGVASIRTSFSRSIPVVFASAGATVE